MDNRKNHESMIGRIAVNQAGRVGRVKKFGVHRASGKVAYFGAGADGKPWAATSVTLIDESDASILATAFRREDARNDPFNDIFGTAEIAKVADAAMDVLFGKKTER